MTLDEAKEIIREMSSASNYETDTSPFDELEKEAIILVAAEVNQGRMTKAEFAQLCKLPEAH